MLDIFNSARALTLIAIVICLFAIGAALNFQYNFGLLPCELCIWQRIPYFITIFTGFGALLFIPSMAGRIFILLAAISMIVEFGIALFHSGVERKLWKGLETCSGSAGNLSLDNLSSNGINNASFVKCNEITWDLFGLSMANYNIILSLILALIFFRAYYLSIKLKSYDRWNSNR